MPVDAMSLADVGSRTRCDVRCTSLGRQMLPVDTPAVWTCTARTGRVAVVALMIDDHALGDRAYEILVGGAVGLDRHPVASKTPIPMVVGVAGVVDAAVGLRLHPSQKVVGPREPKGAPAQGVAIPLPSVVVRGAQTARQVLLLASFNRACTLRHVRTSTQVRASTPRVRPLGVAHSSHSVALHLRGDVAQERLHRGTSRTTSSWTPSWA